MSTFDSAIAAPRLTGARRDPGLVLLASILTCGIYYIFWIYWVSTELQDYLQEYDTTPTLDAVLSLITCGIYTLYWDYKTAKKIARIQVMQGIAPTDNSILYLILDCVGAGLVNCVLEQGALNDIWRREARRQPARRTRGEWLAGAWCLADLVTW